MRLDELFDEALDGGPAHRPIEERLVIGRRAHRRRRTAMGATALATTIVLGALGWAALPGEGARTAGDESVANAPTTQASIEPPLTAPDEAYAIFCHDDTSYPYSCPGKFKLAPGAVIVSKLDNPSTDANSVSSEAVIATFEGKTWWAMTVEHKSGSGWTGAVEATDAEFEQWVLEMNVSNDNSDRKKDDPGGGPETGWVTLGDDGILTPRHDVTILEQAVVPQTGDMPDGGPSATATIEVEGGRFCVYAEPVVHGRYYSSEAADPGCVRASVRPDFAKDPDPALDDADTTTSPDAP